MPRWLQIYYVVEEGLELLIFHLLSSWNQIQSFVQATKLYPKHLKGDSYIEEEGRKALRGQVQLADSPASSAVVTPEMQRQTVLCFFVSPLVECEIEA